MAPAATELQLLTLLESLPPAEDTTSMVESLQLEVLMLTDQRLLLELQFIG